MYVTNRPATAIIIALTPFLIATLALACSSATRRAGDVNTDRAALATLYNATNGSSLSIFMVIRPAIFTDIQPPWERGELTIIRL